MTYNTDLLDRAKRHPEKQKNADKPMGKKPDWIRVKAPQGKVYSETLNTVKGLKLTTVCEEAGCPNIGECWDKKHATFMIMGEVCTRACSFCNVATGKPNALDKYEPLRVGVAEEKMGVEKVGVVEVGRRGTSAERAPAGVLSRRAGEVGGAMEVCEPHREGRRLNGARNAGEGAAA